MTEEEEQYVREMVIFAPQNVIMDPPFTKLDVLSPLAEIKVCVAYEGEDGTRYDHVPYHRPPLSKRYLRREIEAENLQAIAPVPEVGLLRVAGGSVARKARRHDQARTRAQQLDGDRELRRREPQRQQVRLRLHEVADGAVVYAPEGASRAKLDLIAAQGDGFWRLRIGVGHPGTKHEVVDFVLTHAGKDEQRAVIQNFNLAMLAVTMATHGASRSNLARSS